MPNDVRTDEWTVKILVAELRSAQGEDARDWTEELFKRAADLIEALAAHDAKVRADTLEQAAEFVMHTKRFLVADPVERARIMVGNARSEFIESELRKRAAEYREKGDNHE